VSHPTLSGAAAAAQGIQLRDAALPVLWSYQSQASLVGEKAFKEKRNNVLRRKPFSLQEIMNFFS